MKTIEKDLTEKELEYWYNKTKIFQKYTEIDEILISLEYDIKTEDFDLIQIYSNKLRNGIGYIPIKRDEIIIEIIEYLKNNLKKKNIEYAKQLRIEK